MIGDVIWRAGEWRNGSSLDQQPVYWLKNSKYMEKIQVSLTYQGTLSGKRSLTVSENEGTNW